MEGGGCERLKGEQSDMCFSLPFNYELTSRLAPRHTPTPCHLNNNKNGDNEDNCNDSHQDRHLGCPQN